MRNKLWIILLTFAVVGLALRYWLLIVTDSHTTDGIAYLSVAEYMRDSVAFPDIPKRITMPFYPFLVYLFSFVTGGNVVSAGRCVSMIVGIGIIPLVFILARNLFNEYTAIIAAVLISADWLFIVNSTLDRADILFALLTIILVIYFWRIDWRKTQITDALFFGMLMGLTQLTRTNGVLYFAVFIVFWIFYINKYKIKPASFIISTFIPLLIVYCLIASIPILYLKSIDATQQSYIGHAFLEGSLDALGDREQDAYKLNEDATNYIVTEQIREFSIDDIWRLKSTLPAKFISGWHLIGASFVEAVLKYFKAALLFIIPLIVLFILKRNEVDGWNQTGYLISFSIPFIFLMPIIQMQESYLVPLWPIFIIVLSWFISEAYNVEIIGKFTKPTAILIILIVVFVSLHHLYDFRSREAMHSNGYKLAGEFLKERGSPDDTIMARDNTIYFYAGMRGYRPPSESLERTIKFCRHMGIDYFVLGPMERKERPELTQQIIELIESGDTTFEIILTETRGSSDIYILQISDDNSVTSNF